MSSPPQTPSPSLQVQGHDYLASLPVEFFIKILVHVPLKSFLDVAHTSRNLHNLVRMNAGQICNEAILERYPLQARLLQAKVVDGWLVPIHEQFTMVEAKLEIPWRQEISKDKLFSITGRRKSDHNFVRVTEPGPQFSAMLEKGVRLMVYFDRTQCIDLAKDARSFFERWGKQGYFIQELSKFVQSFNCIKLGFKQRSHEGCVYKLAQPLLKHKVVPNYHCFPQELIWYFGIERLRVDGVSKNEDEDDAWKKQPMLLWE